MVENSEALEDLELGDIIQKYLEKTSDGVITHEMDDDDCRDFSAPDDGFSRGFNSIFTLDPLMEEFEFEADQVVGNSPLVYASGDVLVITDSSWSDWWFWDR